MKTASERLKAIVQNLIGNMEENQAAITDWIGIDDVRKAMLGQNRDAYARYSEFKRHVLMPAIRDVNEMTAGRLDMQEQKSQRRVTHIRFMCEHKRLLLG